ncbi:hypothetical protein IV203_000075 (plastid) [Nitzschia inconspicua]|uniref:Uncharacterized protein n=1 Tax=Nitzschia inconspicua TaxID=303405 RepID=A0A8H2SI93_9STRA|nr:hypothetical protein IV203_000019 [Nitzschia inconspicua]QXE46153.1 hypothetical protein IV203_000075 [Nitzschia inconspicua]
MTLFVNYKTRSYEINDLYLMAITFIVTFYVTSVCKKILTNYLSKKSPGDVEIKNPRGGAIPSLTDDNELGMAILTCISDNGIYHVKDKNLRRIVFELAKEKLTNESLIITPNLIRFVGLRLINPNQTTVVTIGNFLTSTDNRVRLILRFSASVIAGIIAGIASSLSYGILLLLICFLESEQCGFSCDTYFDKIPPEPEAINVYTKNRTGNLIITGNDAARQVEIYIPSKAKAQIRTLTDKQKTITKTYHSLPKRAKQVTFEDFRKNDPVLSKFADLPEPDVPQQVCKLRQIAESIDRLE